MKINRHADVFSKDAMIPDIGLRDIYLFTINKFMELYNDKSIGK